MPNKNEFVPLSIEMDEEKQRINIENPLLRVKKKEIEIEVFQGIERYMFFHLMKEWV